VVQRKNVEEIESALSLLRDYASLNYISQKEARLLSSIEGKHVKITGRIELYKGKPELRINAAEQLEVE
jgi:DNA/RNA endonuclease YhcR with UshA esterase domain